MSCVCQPTIKDKESNFDVKFLYYSPMMTPEAKVTGRLQKLFPMVDNDELKREQIVNSRVCIVTFIGIDVNGWINRFIDF